MAIVASFLRSPSSLNKYGETIKVDIQLGEDRTPQIMISTNQDYLIFYTLTVSQPSDSRYKLETVKGSPSQRRQSLVSAVDTDYFAPYSLKYKRTRSEERRVGKEC